MYDRATSLANGESKAMTSPSDRPSRARHEQNGLKQVYIAINSTIEIQLAIYIEDGNGEKTQDT